MFTPSPTILCSKGTTMKKSVLLLSLATLASIQARAGDIVVIGHSTVPKMDMATIQKVYTGKVIAVAGVNVTAVNAKPGVSMRNSFLHGFLNQDDDKYIAYWTVRRYIGKGAPPIELTSTADIVNYVQSTPGAIGYVDETEVKPGMNVIARK
jgi:hypothetical protein